MWYVIQIQTGKEETIKKAVENVFPKGIYDECKIIYCEKKRKYLGSWHTEQKPMFPGYVFIITDYIDQVFFNLKKIPTLTRILDQDRKAIPISAEEENLLLRLSGDNGVAEMSYGIIEGDRIEVTSGSLKGLETNIKKVNRHKRTAEIEIEFLGSLRTVELGLEIVRKVE